MLPKEAIEEYKILYQKRYGILLTDVEAALHANKLIGFYRAVLGTESPEIKSRDQNNGPAISHDKN